MKYRLTDEKMLWRGRTLYRIQALEDFGNIKAGDKGGWVENERNLSQEGCCWVYDNARVFDYAIVFDSAKVFDSANVFGSARVYGSAEVRGYAQVFASAEVFNYAIVFNSAEVRGSVKATKNPINLQVYYNITITDEHIIIGCQCHTYQEWLNFTNDEINQMDIKALEFWKKYKNIVLEIFRNERGVK